MAGPSSLCKDIRLFMPSRDIHLKCPLAVCSNVWHAIVASSFKQRATQDNPLQGAGPANKVGCPPKAYQQRRQKLGATILRRVAAFFPELMKAARRMSGLLN